MLLTRINYFCFCSKINLESCLPEISNILLQKLQFISLKIKLSSSPTNNEQLFILCCWETAASDHVEDCDHSKYHEDDQSGLSQLDQEVNIILVTWKQKLVLTYWQHFWDSRLGTGRIQDIQRGCCCRCRNCCCRCCPGPEAPRILGTELSNKKTLC